MNKYLLVTLGLCINTLVSAQILQSESLATLPSPLTNNAVTAVTVADREYIISFAGLASGKEHGDTLDVTYVLDVQAARWSKANPLPGGVGRLASTAANVGELAYVFGGYTVADDGSEVSVPWVHAFDPASSEFKQRQSMPVPVDDAIAMSYQDRYIYLLSGWHDYGNVNLVQRYDTETDSWKQATPIPGPAVFGHAGGIVNGPILSCDGVTIRPNTDKPRDFVASKQCFLGLIDADDSRRIDWRTIDAHPGRPRYRMASAGLPDNNAVLFIGGSENPYNYNGIGYDGNPSEPASGLLLFDLDSMSWRVVEQSNAASMDHRGLVRSGDRWLTVGGMLAGQVVTDRVVAYRLTSDP
jgi:hypothetical protein